MSFEVKDNTYVYLRYNEEKGKQVTLYVGKFLADRTFVPLENNIPQAQEYFLRIAYKNYSIAKALKDGNPIYAKANFDEEDYERWKKRQRMTGGSTSKEPIFLGSSWSHSVRLKTIANAMSKIPVKTQATKI